MSHVQMVARSPLRVLLLVFVAPARALAAAALPQPVNPQARFCGSCGQPLAPVHAAP